MGIFGWGGGRQRQTRWQLLGARKGAAERARASCSSRPILHASPLPQPRPLRAGAARGGRQPRRAPRRRHPRGLLGGGGGRRPGAVQPRAQVPGADAVHAAAQPPGVRARREAGCIWGLAVAAPPPAPPQLQQGSLLCSLPRCSAPPPWPACGTADPGPPPPPPPPPPQPRARVPGVHPLLPAGAGGQPEKVGQPPARQRQKVHGAHRRVLRPRCARYVWEVLHFCVVLHFLDASFLSPGPCDRQPNQGCVRVHGCCSTSLGPSCSSSCMERGAWDLQIRAGGW